MSTDQSIALHDDQGQLLYRLYGFDWDYQAESLLLALRQGPEFPTYVAHNLAREIETQVPGAKLEAVHLRHEPEFTMGMPEYRLGSSGAAISRLVVELALGLEVLMPDGRREAFEAVQEWHARNLNQDDEWFDLVCRFDLAEGQEDKEDLGFGYSEAVIVEGRKPDPKPEAVQGLPEQEPSSSIEVEPIEVEEEQPVEPAQADVRANEPSSIEAAPLDPVVAAPKPVRKKGWLSRLMFWR